MKILSFFQLIIFINIFEIIISLRYPINKYLDNSTGEISLINIETRKSYFNYTKEGKAISLFYSNYCKYCKYALETFKWTSTYINVSDWKFLSINCTEKQLLCNYFNITRFPYIKTYINKTQLPFEAPFELIPLLEYLIKISTPSFIEINDSNISKFYLDYDYFSPIVQYNSKNNPFYNCISKLAENNFKTYFYFGMKQIPNLNITGTNNLIKEKIIIDNNGAPFIYLWDNNCSNVENFLNKHIFPLITIVNEDTFFYEMNKAKKLLVMLFGFLSNNKTKFFIDNYYKYLAYENNKYIFSFLNYSNTKPINHYFGVKLYADSELKLIIFDFNKTKYYDHSIIYDINFNKPEEILIDFNITIKNLSNVFFTSGYFFKDLLNKYGIYEINSKFCLILIFSILFFTIFISISCTFFCKKICPSEIDENDCLDFNSINNNQNLRNNDGKFKKD